MNNLAYSFALWLQENEFGIINQNLYIGGAPQDAPDACYWITASGGAPVKRNPTGGMQKNYEVQVFYRDTDEEVVYDIMAQLELILNSKQCIDLDGYTTIQISATVFPTDQDVDNNDRSIGTLHATILAYQTE